MTTDKSIKAVFLDRDGTLIVEPPHERLVLEKDEKIFPDAIEDLALLAENNIPIVIVTNQAGIAEGILTEENFNALNDDIIEMIKPSGVKYLKTYFCPHGRDDGCECRKPKPKMILDAAKEFDIDLASSYMIGDNLRDVEAGINAGTKTILVKTGIHDVTAENATYTAKNLLEAVQYIVEH